LKELFVLFGERNKYLSGVVSHFRSNYHLRKQPGQVTKLKVKMPRKRKGQSKAKRTNKQSAPDDSERKRKGDPLIIEIGIIIFLRKYVATVQYM